MIIISNCLSSEVDLGPPLLGSGSHKVILLHNNARSRATVATKQTILILVWEVQITTYPSPCNTPYVDSISLVYIRSINQIYKKESTALAKCCGEDGVGPDRSDMEAYNYHMKADGVGAHGMVLTCATDGHGVDDVVPVTSLAWKLLLDG